MPSGNRLGQMSCKSVLKSQVGIISLGAFQVFCEATAATQAHDSMDSRLLRSIPSTAVRRLTCLSRLVFQEIKFLKQAKGLRPLEDLEDLSAVSAYGQNGSG